MNQELARNSQVKIEKSLNPQKRQTVLSGRKGKTYADFIEPSTGLSVVAKASTQDPIIFTTANGFDQTGPVDTFNRLTADQTFSGLIPNATNYLGFERVDQYNVNKIISTNQPIYGSIFGSDRENKFCATFDNTLGLTTVNDFYGNPVRMYNGAAIAAGHPSSSGNSLRLGGTDDYAEVDLSVNRINLNTLETWTIEFWFKLDTVNTGIDQVLFCANTINMIDVFKSASSATDIAFRIGDGNVFFINSTFTVGTLSNATWYHIAIVYEGRNYKVYRDGVLRYSSGIIAADYNIGQVSRLFLGKYSSNISWMTGNISNFAIWPYAKYTGNTNTLTTSVFATSTTNLTEDAVVEDRYFRLKDRAHIDFANATANTSYFRETYGNQVIFAHNGSGTNQPFIESIAGPTGFGTVKTAKINTDGALYTSIQLRNMILPRKFTVECFIRPIAVGSTYNFIEIRNDNNNFGGIVLGHDGSRNYSVSISVNGSGWLFSGTVGDTFLADTWYHVAISFDGENYRIFYNGVLTQTVASILHPFNGNKISFGGNDGTSVNSFRGNIFMPIITPYAKYISSFTPPTSFPVPENVYYYDINKAKMYEGYVGNWTETPTIFIGEAETNVDSVIRAHTYSLNGEVYIDEIDAYGSGVNSINTTYVQLLTMPHYIGTTRINIDYWARFIINNTSYSNETRFKPMTYYAPGTTHEGDPIKINNHNYFSLQVGTSGFLFFAETGGAVGFAPNNTQIKWEFKIERDF